MTEPRDTYRDWDAAYLLGALTPAERREFERHLSDCGHCAAAVAELAGMPGILGLLSAADAGAAGDTGDPLRNEVHQPSEVQRLAARARVERHRTRRLLGAVATVVAVMLVAVGVALGGTVLAPRLGEAAPSPSSTAPADVLEMAPLASATLTAELSVTPKKWGTLLAWECRYGDTPWIDPARGAGDPPRYALYVTEADGTETAVATWRAAGERAGGLTAATSIPTDDIRSIEIRTVPENTPLARATL
ncbi:MAG: zf-HC2 domain-containing protein [Mycetocola sp.]